MYTKCTFHSIRNTYACQNSQKAEKFSHATQAVAVSLEFGTNVLGRTPKALAIARAESPFSGYYRSARCPDSGRNGGRRRHAGLAFQAETPLQANI